METANWNFALAVDINPTPGAFVSQQPAREFEPVGGHKVTAFNWMHAEYLLAMQTARDSEGVVRCAHCNQPLRAVVVLFSSPDGKLHGVGRDCARFIAARMPKDAFEKLELLREIKQVNTKNGPRAALKFPSPSWMQFLPREKRPSFVSLSPWENRKGDRVWYATVWGADTNEVLENYATLMTLRDKALKGEL